jgi:deoxyribonuclease-4
MVKAVDRASEIGAEALQVFTDNPTSWTRRAEPPREIEAFRQRLIDYAIGPVAIHAAYLINPAGSDPTSRSRSIDLLAAELRAAPMFRARFVNVHTGSHKDAGADQGIANVADAAATALTDVDDNDDAAMLVLENSTGAGNGVGATVGELAAILDAVAARGVPEHRVGLCLDTAHAWGFGHDIADPKAVDALLEDIRASIGLHRLVMVHLNDSRSERGSRTDRHEHIGAGRIGPAGLGHLLRHPAVAHTTVYLETPGMDQGYDATNMARARALARGDRLPDLPKAAFALGGSARARTAPA